MNKSQKFLAAAGVFALGLSALSTGANAQAHEGDTNKDIEKCYGVAKAGSNDCGSSPNNHSCAGQAAKDGDKNEWVAVPKGLCEKLAGGSLKAGS